MTKGAATISAAGPRDAAVVRAVEEAAFGASEEANLVEALAADPAAAPLSLLARSGGRAVGHVLFTAVTVGQSDVSAAILAPLAVVPDAQRRGVGSALVREGLAMLEQRGVRLVFVLGDPAYYSRLGAEPAEPLGLHPPHRVSHPGAWRVWRLAGAPAGVAGVVRPARALQPPELWQEPET